MREGGGRLVTLWASDRGSVGRCIPVLSIAFQDDRGLQIVEVALAAEAPQYPDVSAVFPVAGRLQRAAFDLSGVRAIDGDTRPWLRHGAWPADVFPLRAERLDDYPGQRDNYAFVRVSGDGVHEIPVGPVHAGVIEPGHFRFSVVGEKVLRLEQRLGYVHKGIEKRFESMSMAEGVRLAARICGDSAVAYAWAYCIAVEQVSSTRVPPRGAWLRALLLERERLANHLGDLGALGNDAGFAFGQVQFSRLKEDLLRLNARLFGHRYLFDVVVPGGVSIDVTPERIAELAAEAQHLARDVRVLRDIYDDHAGVQDRFAGAGILAPAVASRLGVVGPAGRASGQSWDLRCTDAAAPYNRFGVRRALRESGDVAARVAIRFDEIFESLRLCGLILDGLPDGSARQCSASDVDVSAQGYGCVEGWRGPVFVALDVAGGGRIRRCHPHDPSWQNWPALEHAVVGNIVADFPLINKSFNLSYSGHDL